MLTLNIRNVIVSEREEIPTVIRASAADFDTIIFSGGMSLDNLKQLLICMLMQECAGLGYFSSLNRLLNVTGNSDAIYNVSRVADRPIGDISSELHYACGFLLCQQYRSKAIGGEIPYRHESFWCTV